jgi:hypothetical protein
MSSESGPYRLLWKGRESGPFPLEEIEARLVAGEISRLHQIQVNGRWQILDDFLEKLRHHSPVPTHSTISGRELGPVRETALEKYARPGEPPSALGRLLPKWLRFGASHPAPLDGEPFDADHPHEPAFRPRLSVWALAALLLALCDFIPYVNFVSWIPALIFGHIALHRIDRDDTLFGRGLAVTALVITYFLLIVFLTFVVLMVANHQPLHF